MLDLFLFLLEGGHDGSRIVGGRGKGVLFPHWRLDKKGKDRRVICAHKAQRRAQGYLSLPVFPVWNLQSRQVNIVDSRDFDQRFF